MSKLNFQLFTGSNATEIYMYYKTYIPSDDDIAVVKSRFKNESVFK